MILTAHQPVYFPWLGLLAKIASADGFVSWDDVPLDSSSATSFENRNRILASNGPQWLTVPIIHKRDQPIREIRIAQTQPWRRKHYRSLEMAYAKAPRWPDYQPWLKQLYEKDWELLVDLNEEILTMLLRAFRVNVQRWKLSEIRPRPVGTQGADELCVSKSQPIIDACRHVGAHVYIFGARGKGYADQAAFAAAGVEPRIQEFRAKPYSQGRSGFEPNLSALDLLMWVDRNEARQVMDQSSTITRLP